MINTMRCSFTILALCLVCKISQTCAFTSSKRSSICSKLDILNRNRITLDDEEEEIAELEDIRSFWWIKTSRRKLISGGAALLSSSSFFPLFAPSLQAAAVEDSSLTFKPSIRATAYLVDSTIPPTLIPISKAREAAILKNLGNGLGTSKKPFVEDEITLNNMMNKGVFGTVNLIRSLLEGDPESSQRKNVGGVSFIFLGVSNIDSTSLTNHQNLEDVQDDIGLAVQLITDIIKPRRSLVTAIGLDFAPQSTQDALNTYLDNNIEEGVTNPGEEEIMEAMSNAQVPREVVELHMPILRLAKKKRLNLLALAPEVEDVRLVRTSGLESLNAEKRLRYVSDTEGFVSSTQDPTFRLFADKSLLKDFEPMNEKDQPGNYFAERILVHEAEATKIANYASSRPNSLVVTLAPIKDLRFMGGPNKRIIRLMKFIQPDYSVEEEAVTTILINPSARETLSLSRFLRLEIGTSPSTIPYQTKVADYLWFSSMPKVNMVSGSQRAEI
jgi:hypothetical protein